MRDRLKVAGRLLFASGAALLALSVPAASAATGDLTPQGCFQDVGFGPDRCDGQTAEGLNQAFAVAVSPDGKSVYATGIADDAVSIFSRNISTGALTPVGCIADDGLTSCPSTAEGLEDPYGITVSSDGLSVLVASAGDDAIANLERNPTTGLLTDAGCVANTNDIAGCGGPTQTGLASANGVAVDPEGEYVYAIGAQAIVRLTRDPNTGDLAPDGCVAATGDAPGCGAVRPGLADASSIAISADGSSLHVAGRLDGAVVSVAAPSLDSRGCISDNEAPIANCTTSTQGLGSVRSVAISPDGKSVYAGGSDGAVVRFDRDVNSGVLTAVGCISDTGLTIGCTSSQQGLKAAWSVAVSPDDQSVYAVGEDDAIVYFDRNATSGALTPKGCIEEFPIGCTLGSVTGGLNTGRGLAVSPDNTSVYTTSYGDSAIARFDREGTGILLPPGEVTFKNTGLTCKAACRKTKIKVKVDDPGKVTFCSAPAGVNAPCGLNGPGPTGPDRLGPASGSRAGRAALIKTKRVNVKKAGTVNASLTLTRKARKTLAKKHRLKLKLQVDFTRTGGERASERKTLKIKRKG